MSAFLIKPRKSRLNRVFSGLFSCIIVANFFAPTLAYADNSNLVVSQTINFTSVGSSSWVVPSGVSTVDVKVWAAGGAGGSGQKTDNSNLSGLGGGGGGYTEETISVNVGDTYAITVGAGGQGDGQNGGASSFVGANANLLTTGGLFGAVRTGTGPGYPTAGGAGGIGNGGPNATNLGGGNGGTEGCDPNNCGGNARASGGGGAAAGGVGGAGLGFGDTNGIAGSSGTTGISGGGAGGAAGWQGRDGSCTSGCGAGGPNAGDGVFPGGGGGGSDAGIGGFGANGEVVVEVLSAPAPADIAPVGFLDNADCSNISGWAADQDVGTSSIYVDVYADGLAGSGGIGIAHTLANTSRPDVPINDTNIIGDNHGFTFATPDSLKDGNAHKIYAYGIDANGSNNVLLTNSPISITCPNPSGGNLLSQAPASSTDATIQLGQSFTPSEVGGSGTGNWQFVILGSTNWNRGIGNPAGTDLGNSPSTDGAGSYASSWTPAATGTYQFYVEKNGDSTYADSNTAGPYTLTVNPVPVSGGGGGNSTYVLNVFPQGTNPQIAGGTVTSSPAGISCSAVSGCSATFNTGASVTLTATPDAGNIFVGWGNDCASSGTASTCALVMNSGLIARATFAISTTTPNSAPFAPAISGPTTGTTSVSYSFTASSTDPDGDNLTYLFDWNNDGVIDATTSAVASGVSVMESNTWPAAGTYTFAVIVVDSHGATATSTRSIVISDATSASSGGGNTPPVVAASVSSGGGGGGGAIRIGDCVGFGCPALASTSSAQTITTVTTTVANASANAPVIPVVGQSVCKAGDYITAYMRQGIDNNPADVVKLQNFLNQYEGANLDVNGTFDASTTVAVKAFQLKYAKDVLSPWGIDYPTGIVYITTAHEINNIFCSLNPDYTGGPSATTTPQFNGAVGFNVATGSVPSTLGLNQNIAGIIGAISPGLKDFLKDILWYPLLILLLLGTGIWLILRYIFLKDIKDKKDIQKQKVCIQAIGLFSLGSVLNLANTLFYILVPALFMEATHLDAPMILGLDLINIVLILVAGLSSLYIFQQYIARRAISLA